MRCLPVVLNNAPKRLFTTTIDKKRFLLTSSVLQQHQALRYKSRKTGALDGLDSKHLSKYASDLLHLLEKRRDPLEKDIKKWRNDLSGVLFQYSRRLQENSLLRLFEKMVAKSQANEASFTIIMRYYAEQGDYDRVKLYFEQMKNSGIQYHGRSFVPLIVLSLKLDKLEDTQAYFEMLQQNARKTFVHNAFIEIVEACADLRKESGKEHVLMNQMISEVFRAMERYGSEPLDKDAIRILFKWFNRYVLLFKRDI